MKTTTYRGYHSYDYLDPDTDYDAFKLAPELDRVAPLKQGLSPAIESRVQRIFEQHVIISLHDHPTVRPADPADAIPYRRQGRDVTGYEGLQASGLDVVFDGMMNGTAFITSRTGWKWGDILADLGMRLCDWAHQDFVVPILRVSDIHAAKANGQIGIVPNIESATPIENELDRLDILYGFGLRTMGLVYSQSNSVGSGLADNGDAGLTRFGHAAVHRMNQLGMLVDVAHAGDQTSLDAVKTSTQPVVISHAGARALWPTNRMKPDDVITACAERGGLIGIEAAPHTTITRKHPRHSLESVMEHFEYCADLVGIDHVTFGPDTHFGDHVAWHHHFAKSFSIDGEGATPNYEPVDYVEGVENPGEAFLNLARWLVIHNYSDDEIAAALGGNVMRVLQQVWR